MAKKSRALSAPSSPRPAEDWEAHEALHHLTRAHEIQRDPKLMARATKLATERRDALTKIARKKPQTNSKRK